MRLSPRSFLCLALAAAIAPAYAAEDAAALDLVLPQQAYRNDPPGMYYGDTSGVPAAVDAPAATVRDACPTAPDGTPTDLTGEVTLGMAHSQLGTGRYGGVGLNYCKSYTEGDGADRTINVRLDIDQAEGPVPGYGPAYGPGYGPGAGRGYGGARRGRGF